MNLTYAPRASAPQRVLVVLGLLAAIVGLGASLSLTPPASPVSMAAPALALPPPGGPLKVSGPLPDGCHAKITVFEKIESKAKDGDTQGKIAGKVWCDRSVQKEYGRVGATLRVKQCVTPFVDGGKCPKWYEVSLRHATPVVEDNGTLHVAAKFDLMFGNFSFEGRMTPSVLMFQRPPKSGIRIVGRTLVIKRNLATANRRNAVD